MNKNIATFGKQIIAACASYVYDCISRTGLSVRLEYNSLFVALGGWAINATE